MLLERFSRKSRERRQANSYYETLLGNPIHRLLTILLEHAVDTEALAISFGFRGDNESLKAHIAPGPEEVDSEIAQCVARAMGPVDPRISRAANESASMRGPHGLGIMPVWALYAERIDQWVPIPLHVYLTILAEIENRLVSLDGTPEVPSPRKYIEISPKQGQRRLVEVDLEWNIHDQFTIHVRAQRQVPPESNISTYYY